MPIHDPAKLKLGKKSPAHDPRTLKLASYLNRAFVPQAPAACDWTKAVPSWPMMLNDRLGDCTCAAAGHMIELFTGNNGDLYVPTDSDIESAYEAVGGYRPGDESTDNGAVELDVLRYWRDTGVSGRKIDAFVAVEHRNVKEVKEAIFLFGGVYAGVALPISAQDQDVWDVTTGQDAYPGSWGGHAIPLVAYDAQGLVCVTWGALKRMTWNWWATYGDEAYAALSRDWAPPANAPAGRFNYQQLMDDLRQLG